MSSQKKLPGVTRLAESGCPFCGHKLDAAGTPDGSPETPEPGNVTVCIECARVLFFTDDLMLRKPHPGELETLLVTDPEWGEVILRVQQMIRAIPDKNPRRRPTPA